MCSLFSSDALVSAELVFFNYGVQSMFHSSDGGSTWTAVGGNLEEFPDGSGNGPSIRCTKLLSYQDKKIIFAGTTLGLYSATSLEGENTVWTQEGPESIGTIMVDMIDARSMDGFTAIATHGNGIYSTFFDPAASVDEAPQNRKSAITNFPNPFKNQTTVKYQINQPAMVNLLLYDLNGRLIRKLFTGFQQEGYHSFNLEVPELPAGTYTFKLQAGGMVTSGKMMKTDW
jgi:hypothetical protein